MERRRRNNIPLPRMNYEERSDNTRVAPIIPLKVQKAEQANYTKTSEPLADRIERQKNREYYDRLYSAREESKKSVKEAYEREQAKRDAQRAEDDRKHAQKSKEVEAERKRDFSDFWNQVQTKPESLAESDKDFLSFYEKYRKVLPTEWFYKSETVKKGMAKVWFDMKDRVGSLALSSIKVNGDNINSRIGFNEAHQEFAKAHQQMLDYQEALGNLKRQQKDFINHTGYSPEVLAANPNNKQVQQLKYQYDQFDAAIKDIEAAMNQDPNLKSLDDAYKQLYASRKASMPDWLRNLYHGLVDLTTWPQYKDYVANKRLNDFKNQYDNLINNKYSEQSGADQLKSQDPDKNARLIDFDRNETGAFVEGLKKEKEDLQRQYIENREHLAKSTDYWKVRDSYIKGEQLHQNDKLWDWDYWSFEVPTMIGSSASSPSQGMSMAIQTAGAIAGVLESAAGAPELAVPTMIAAQAITSPLDWIAMYDENYAETGTKRISNLKDLLSNPAFVPESSEIVTKLEGDGKKTMTFNSTKKHYKQIMHDLKTKSAQYWLDKGMSWDYIQKYLLGPEGDENVLRDLIGGLISTTDPRVLRAMTESTRGLEAQLFSDNVRTGSEMLVQKMLLTPGLSKLKRSVNTMLNNAERMTIDGVRSVADDLAKTRTVFDAAGRATIETEDKIGAQLAAEGTRKYKNGFRAPSKTLAESVTSGAETGATVGDILGLGIVGEGIGSVVGGTARGAAHMAREMMPARVRNVFYTMQEGFARKYADIYDKLMPTKEWKKFALRYGIQQAKASTVSSMSERAEEAVQYLNEKENFSDKYGWNRVNLTDMLAHDFKQGGRVLNSYLAALGLSQSELMDDQEYWANQTGGAALGFLHNAVIGSISSIREANSEARLANTFLRAGIMNRELDKFSRIQNIEMARQAMSGRGNDMIQYIKNQMHEDSRRENPHFDQEDYDELLDAAQNITALANNKRIRQNLADKGILPNSENFAIAIADMYSYNQQIADNKEQFDKNENSLLRIYNGAKYPAVWRQAQAAMMEDPSMDQLDMNDEEREIWTSNYVQQAKFLNVMYNRLAALVNLRAKHNTIDDFFNSIHSKFGLSTKRPDVRIVRKSIDDQIKDVISEIKKVDTDFSATSDKDIIDYIASVQQPIDGVDQEEIEQLEQAQAMLRADMNVLQAHSSSMSKQNYRQRIETIKDVMARNAALDWLVNDVYEGDAVTDFIERTLKEEAEAEAAEIKKEVENESKVEDPLKGSVKPSVEKKIEKVKSNLSKNKQEFERRKEEAKKRYQRRRDRYKKWRKGNLNSGIPFMDTIVATSQMLLRASEVGAYKFKQFVDDIKDIYDDVNMSDMMPIIKHAYIQASAKYSVKKPDILKNLSSAQEVIDFVHEEENQPASQPDASKKPLHKQMQDRFNEKSEKIVPTASSHYDQIVRDGTDVKVYRNEQAIINSHYGLSEHKAIRDLVNNLESIKHSEEDFRNKLLELQRSKPDLDVDFYTANRNVAGMTEAIAHKYYEQTAHESIINGKKTLFAVTSILLGKPVDKSQYPATFDQFEQDILQLKEQLTSLGLTILNTEKYIYGRLPNGQLVSSQADIIAVDDSNKIWVIDVRSGRTPILNRLNKPGYYSNSTIKDEVQRGLNQIEQIITSEFGLPVQATYLLPVIYDSYNGIIQVDKNEGNLLTPFKQTKLERYSEDLSELKNTAETIVSDINRKIGQYNLYIPEAKKYSDRFEKLDEAVLEQFNSAEEYQQYIQRLQVRNQTIDDLQEDIVSTIEQNRNLEQESFEQVNSNRSLETIPEDTRAVFYALVDAVRDLDICAQYIPEVKVTSKLEADNVRAIYTALFEAQRRLSDFIATEGSDQINIQNEEECIASVMERMAMHPESFGRDSVFVKRWWLNSFILTPTHNTAYQVRNQFEQTRAYVKMINSWVNTLENHVINDLDNHRPLQIWYSTLLNNHFTQLLDNAQQFVNSLDKSTADILAPVIERGRSLVERFNNTWGAPTDEYFSTPPADELERASRMPVKWMDKYGETSFHYPATDAMYISGGYYFMSIQPDFLSNVKFNFYIVQRDKKVTSRDGSSSYMLKKGDVAVYLEYNNGQQKWFADLPFKIDPSNYPNPSQDDLLRFAQINRGNVRFTEKIKEMLSLAGRKGLRVTADVSSNKGEIKYNDVGTLNNVFDFLFSGSLNQHNVHKLTVSDDQGIGILFVRDNKALGTKTYEVRTGSNMEKFMAPFNDKYQKEDPQVRSGLLIYMYKTGDGETIAVPMPTKTIGSDALRIADLIYRYTTGQRTIDGFDILTLIKQRVYVKDPAKRLSIYNSKTNMIEFVRNGINIGDQFYNIYEQKQAIVDAIAAMPNIANAGQLNKQLISASDGVLDVAYSKLRSGMSSVTLPNGFTLTLDNFQNGGTWFGYLAENGIVGTRAYGMGLRQINFGNPYFVNAEGEKLYKQSQVEAPSAPQQAGLEEVDDPFAALGALMTVDESELVNRSDAESQEFRKAAEDYFDRVLGQNAGKLRFAPKQQRYLFRVSGTNVAAGLASEAFTDLSLSAPYEAIQHEAFHRVMELLLPEEEREYFYSQYRKKNGINLTTREVAEGLTDLFVDYTLNRSAINKDMPFLKKMRAWFDFCKFMIGAASKVGPIGLYKTLQLYRKVNAGEYASGKYKITKEASERFKKEFGIGLYYTVQNQNDNRTAEFETISNSGELQHMVEGLAFQIMEAKRLSDPNPNVESIVINESTPTILEAQGENGIPIIDELTGKNLQPSQLTNSHMAFREVFESYEVDVKDKKGNKVGTTRVYPKFAAIADRISQYIASIYGDESITIDDSEIAQDDDSGENIELQGMGNDAWDKAAYEINKLNSQSKRVKLFLGTIPAVTRDKNGKIVYDLTKNIYGVPTYMPLREVYNTVVNDLGHVKSILQLNAELQRLAKVSPMYDRILNKFRQVCTGMWTRDEQGNLVIDSDKESFAIQIVGGISSQKMDFIIASSKVDRNGTKNIKIVQSFLGRDAFKLPGHWTKNLISGQVGTFSRMRDRDGNITFADNKVYPNRTDIFSKTADFIVQMQQALMKSGEQRVGNSTYNVDSLEDIAKLKYDLVKMLHNIGIIISENTIDYILLNNPALGATKADRDGGKRGLLNWLSQSGTSSINTFIDLLNNFVFDNGQINQDAVKQGYVKNGFVSSLAEWQSKYNKASVDNRALALNGKELNMISQNNSISKRVDSYNTHDQNNSDVRKLLQYGYNIIQQEKPIGSILAKQLYLKEDFNLTCHVYIGFKTDNKGDLGQEYTQQATIDDYMAKFTMLQNNYMISPALADKTTYVVITGLDIPGMQFINVTDPDTKQEVLTVTGVPTIRFFKGQPYIVPQRSVLSQIREYMLTERLAIQRCMADLGYKNIPGYENEGRTPIPEGAKIENYHKPSKQGVEPNGTRFFGLTQVTVKEDGQLKTYILNDPNKSSVDCLKDANDHFFNLSEEDQLDAIALTLHTQTMAAVRRAIELGVVERKDISGTWKDANGVEHTNKYTKDQENLFNLDSKNLNQDQIEVLTNEIMKQLPHNEFGNWAGIPRAFTGPFAQYSSRANDLIAEKDFREVVAKSLAIAAMINDVTMRSLISTEEYLRCFIGNPAFFGVKYDMDGGKIQDSAYDMQKRIGGLISTGEDNIEGLPYMKKTYVVGEIEDYKVESTADVVDNLRDMFADSMVRDLYAIITDDWDTAFSDKTIDELINSTSGEEKARLETAKQRGYEYADMITQDVNVADGAAYITDTMCENLLRIRGALTDDVKEAFKVLRTQSNAKDNWMKKRDAYNLIYEKVNIVAYKYTAYGFRDHMLNGEVVSDTTVPYYDKFALFPLFPGMATGPMQDIYKKMLDEGVDMAPMHSGVKVGSQTPAVFNGETIEGSFNKYEQEYSDIRRQQNTDPEEGDVIPVGSQMAKIVMQNLRTSRSNYTDVRTGKRITGQQLLDKFMDAINNLSISGGQRLADQFFIEDTVTPDEEKLGKYFADELNSRNANKATVEAIRLVNNEDGSGKHMQAPLAATPDASWIESILISKVKKTVIDIDLPGSSYIQRSAFAMEGKRKEGEGAILSENEINFTINNGKKLQFLNPDGSMDAVISMDYFDRILFKGKLKNMSFEEKRQWLIDHNIIGQNAKPNTVGYRVPTQAESSIHAMRFVDVIPAGQATIILPEEFVTITGADYDIDHLYLVSYNYNTYISEDGIQVVTTSFNPLEEDQQIIDKYYQNTFVDCMMTLLTDKWSVGLLYRPVDGDTGPIKGIAKKIKDEGSTKHLPYNFDMLHEQVIRKNDYITGKIGIAPEALNVTNHQMTKVYHIPFNQTRFTRGVGLYGLDGIVDKDDIYIDSWLSGFINAHVDIVKDNYISKLNVNQPTYNMLNLLIRSGFGDVSVWFLAQPIIRDMSDAINKAKSRYAADQEFAKSPYAAEQYLVSQAVSKYIPEEYLTPENVAKYTTSNDAQDVNARIRVVNFIKQNTGLLEEIAKNPNAETIEYDGVQYKVADIQRTVFFAWKSLEKYAKAVSNFIHFSKIDTGKHGKTLIELARYKDGYMKLYFPEDPTQSIFDVYALQRMAHHSWIHTKTQLAINLPMQILSTQVFDANPQFIKAVFGFANWLSTTGGALNVETLKKLSRHMRTAVKADYFVSKYIPNLLRPGQTVSQYIRNLFNGPNSMNSRLTRLKWHIENNPKYMRLANNHLINQIYSEIVDDDAYAFGRVVKKPEFVTILNNVDNSKINGDLLTDGWEDLLRDEDPFVRSFAHDLIIYSFFTSGEFKGWNKMLKYVPANWILGKYNGGLQSFADYIREALRRPASEYDKYKDIIIANLAMDSQIVSKVPLTNKDGSDNFVDGNEAIKIGIPVKTVQEAKKYIMVRDGVGYNVSNYALYKMVDYEVGPASDEITPIYARMKIRGYNYSTGYNIYEYGFDLNYGEHGKDTAATFDDIAALTRAAEALDKYQEFEENHATASALKEIYYDRYKGEPRVRQLPSEEDTKKKAEEEARKIGEQNRKHCEGE